MDPNELIKAAPQLAKGAGALAAAVPFTAIVKRMLGPAADELAEMLRDQVRLYRYERQIKCLEKAERMAQEAGFTPQPVPPKILFPLLEGASFEEDENLHTMWAALLANAASPENAENVKPGFIAVLRQMAPEEAAIVNWLYDHSDAQSRFHGIPPLKLSQARDELGFRDKERAERTLPLAQRFASCLDGLEAEQLIRRVYWENSDGRPEPKMDVSFLRFSYMVTWRGEEFIGACRPPKPKS
jgi:hypothetical protein